MIDLLRTRRSIRAFKNQQVEPEKISAIEEALLRSPSSRGTNPWRFILVDDSAVLAELAVAKERGGEFLRRAAVGVVIGADERASDVWIEDCSIAAIICQLAAHSLGLGSCWIQIRNRPHDKSVSAEQYIRELVHLPEFVRIECIVAIGYADEAPAPLPESKLQREKICRYLASRSSSRVYLRGTSRPGKPYSGRG
jgi:nitroreductase